MLKFVDILRIPSHYSRFQIDQILGPKTIERFQKPNGQLSNVILNIMLII